LAGGLFFSILGGSEIALLLCTGSRELTLLLCTGSRKITLLLRPGVRGMAILPSPGGRGWGRGLDASVYHPHPASPIEGEETQTHFEIVT
jgi:hypothetical protein